MFAMANRKQRRLLGGTILGFTLIEVLVTLAISMILMTALASIFERSISTRTQIDREGQRLESTRFSLDVLTEDIRLAGYYGPLAVPVGSVDWVYADPCTAGAGWSATEASAIRSVPFPIYGYEAHKDNLTAAPGCITVTNQSSYKAGTDVLVVRRVSTVPGITASDWHLQIAACADTAKDRVPFVSALGDALTAYPLHAIDCTAPAPVFRLITRIYFVSTCDDCTGGGDGVPALKVLDVGATNTFRTLATGVEDLHFEYGVDQTVNAVAANSRDGAVDGYVVSNNAPCTTGCATTTPPHVGGMMLSTSIPATATDAAAGEDRWEDVVAVKLSVLVRDLTMFDGPAMARSYILGVKDNAGTVLQIDTNDRYRRKASTIAVNANNLVGRREQ